MACRGSGVSQGWGSSAWWVQTTVRMHWPQQAASVLPIFGAASPRSQPLLSAHARLTMRCRSLQRWVDLELMQV